MEILFMVMLMCIVLVGPKFCKALDLRAFSIVYAIFVIVGFCTIPLPAEKADYEKILCENESLKIEENKLEIYKTTNGLKTLEESFVVHETPTYIPKDNAIKIEATRVSEKSLFSFLFGIDTLQINELKDITVYIQ